MALSEFDSLLFYDIYQSGEIGKHCSLKLNCFMAYRFDSCDWYLYLIDCWLIGKSLKFELSLYKFESYQSNPLLII